MASIRLISRSAVVGCALLIATPATAQLGAPAPNPVYPGGGATFDLTTAVLNGTGSTFEGILGVARVSDGRTFVSARRFDRTFPHQLFEFDSSMNFVASHNVPPLADDCLWGLRDLAYDGGQIIYGGCDAGVIFAFDTVTGVFDATQAIPVPANLSFGTMRAMAFDPNGDGGNGSLWVASWSSDLIELSRTGNLLRTLPGVQSETFAAAYDASRGTVWWFGQAGSGHPNDLAFVGTEMSTSDGSLTGLQVLGEQSISGLRPGGYVGGVEWIDDGGSPRFLCVAQGDDDFLLELDATWEYGATTAGSISFEGGAPFVGNTGWRLRLDSTVSGSGALVVGVSPLVIPLPPPLFTPGSELLIDATNLLTGSPMLPVANGGSTVTGLAIPNFPSLAGTDVFFQWIVFPQSPMGSLSSSTGGQVQIVR
ncbi:MAG: hypothetical protein AAF196_18940 [Planctomycetota bacterium]